MNLYADDAKIFREIKNLEDCEILQSDLNAIISFLSNWQLKFNVEKCVSVKLMRSRGRRNYAYDYKINGVILKASSCEKDLGVYVSTHPIHGLSFSKHISTICSKARKTCYLIHHFFSTRNTSFKMRLFNTYVRPLLEYASTVRNPFLVKDIDAEIERLKSEGFQAISEKPKRGADNKLVFFFHPKSTNGVLIEICQEIS